MKRLCLLLCLLLVGCAPSVPKPHEHQFVAANYQAPRTCRTCSLTEGDPLTPDFVTHQISLNEGNAVWEKTETGARATLTFAEQSEAITVIPGIEDYYDIRLRDHTETALEDGYSYQVLFYGKRETVTYTITTTFSGWQAGENGMENICTVEWTWDAPDGYDGIVLTLRMDGEWQDGQYLYDVDRTDMMLYKP